MLILARVCADFYDKNRNLLHRITPRDLNLFQDAPESIRKDPLVLMLVDGVSFDLPPQFEGDRVAAPKGELELIYFVNGVIDEVLESGQYQRWFEQYAGYDAARG